MLVEGINAVDHAYVRDNIYGSYEEALKSSRSQVENQNLRAAERNAVTGVAGQKEESGLKHTTPRDEYESSGVLRNLDKALHDYREKNGWTIPRKVKEPVTPLEKAIDKARKSFEDLVKPEVPDYLEEQTEEAAQDQAVKLPGSGDKAQDTKEPAEPEVSDTHQPPADTSVAREQPKSAQTTENTTAYEGAKTSESFHVDVSA